MYVDINNSSCEFVKKKHVILISLQTYLVYVNGAKGKIIVFITELPSVRFSIIVELKK